MVLDDNRRCRWSVVKGRPALGQFLSPDTLVPDAGLVLDYNRYMYVRGNPLKYTDPSGHEPFAPVFDKGSGGGGLLFLAASALTVAAADAVSSDLPHITFGSEPAPQLPSFETPTHKSPTVLDTPLLGPQPRPDYATPGNSATTFQAEGLLEGFSLAGQRSAQDLFYNASDLQKRISGLEKQIAEHERKLEEYIRNPEAHDNLGFLRNAPSEEIRQEIYQSRVRNLQHQINNFRSQVDEIRRQLDNQ